MNTKCKTCGVTKSEGASCAHARANYIRAHYTLTQLPNGDWQALAIGCEWSEKHKIVGPDKAKVISEFRRHWGHFNYVDEAEAFAEIFR